MVAAAVMAVAVAAAEAAIAAVEGVAVMVAVAADNPVAARAAPVAHADHLGVERFAIFRMSFYPL